VSKLQLPETIVISLVGPTGERLHLADVLVGLRTFVNGEYYYGTLLGLTDGTGRLAVSQKEIESRFSSDREMFPMDCRLDLTECDPAFEVFIRGGAEFNEAKRALRDNPFASAEVRSAYEKARNAALNTSAVLTTADWSAVSAELEVDLPGNVRPT